MEIVMKAIVMALAGLVFAAVPGMAKQVCIDSRNIVSSKSTDGKTMVFKMRDGSTLVNHLQGSCPDLKFNGFAWTLRSGDTMVCENAQTLRVIQSPEICTLGKFDPPVMPKPPISAPPAH
jgi:hypothetical protein